MLPPEFMFLTFLFVFNAQLYRLHSVEYIFTKKKEANTAQTDNRAAIATPAQGDILPVNAPHTVAKPILI